MEQGKAYKIQKLVSLLSYHTPMQCKIQKLSVTPSRLWWVHSTCKKKNYLWRRNVQQENKKDRSWLLFLFLPENSITTSTRLAQALISVGLIGGYHTYVNTHYWQINSIIFIIDSIFLQLYSSFPHIIIKGGIFTKQKRHIPIMPIRFGIFYRQKKGIFWSSTLPQFRKGIFWHLRSQFTSFFLFNMNRF